MKRPLKSRVSKHALKMIADLHRAERVGHAYTRAVRMLDVAGWIQADRYARWKLTKYGCSLFANNALAAGLFVSREEWRQMTAEQRVEIGVWSDAVQMGVWDRADDVHFIEFMRGEKYDTGSNKVLMVIYRDAQQRARQQRIKDRRMKLAEVLK